MTGAYHSGDDGLTRCFFYWLLRKSPLANETKLRTPQSSVMMSTTGTLTGNSAVFTFTENNTLRNVKSAAKHSLAYMMNWLMNGKEGKGKKRNCGGIAFEHAYWASQIQCRY